MLSEAEPWTMISNQRPLKSLSIWTRRYHQMKPWIEDKPDLFCHLVCDLLALGGALLQIEHCLYHFSYPIYYSNKMEWR